MREFCQNIEPVRQQSPALNKGGDCFCCALNAGLRHLEIDETLQESYNRFLRESIGGSMVLSNTWSTMLECLEQLHKIDAVAEVVIPNYDLRHWSYAFQQDGIANEYYRRIEGYLKSGWVIFVEYDYYGNGPSKIENDKLIKNHVNHFALLDGVKEYWKPTAVKGCKALTYEVHIVCSAKGTYWIDLDQWLSRYGANAWIMARHSI